MTKQKGLRVRRSGRLQLNSCPADREGAVPFASQVKGSQAGWRQLPTPPTTLLSLPRQLAAPLDQPCPRVLSRRKAAYHLHLHRDWMSLFLFRGSKILCTGPGGRSLQISPTTTDSECSVCGQKASLYLLLSPGALVLLAVPVFPQASSCCWLFSGMCLNLPVHVFIPK